MSQWPHLSVQAVQMEAGGALLVQPASSGRVEEPRPAQAAERLQHLKQRGGHLGGFICRAVLVRYIFSCTTLTAGLKIIKRRGIVMYFSSYIAPAPPTADPFR